MSIECQHGRLKRSCPECELQAEVEELKAERDAQKARADKLLSDRYEEMRVLLDERDKLKAILLEACRHSEWHNKHIYPVDGDAYQTWTLQIYLPVPLNAGWSAERALGEMLKEKANAGRMD